MRRTCLAIGLMAADILTVKAVGQTDAGPAAYAPQPDEQPAQHDESLEFKFNFGGAYTHRFDTDIDSGGAFSNDTLSFGLTVDKQCSDQVALKFQANYVSSSYDF